MTHRTTQPEAVLYFIGDQLLFEHRTTDGAIVRKCISPHTARQAFTHEPLDSGWLSPRVVRWGHNHVGPWCLQRYDPDAYTIRLTPPLVSGHTIADAWGLFWESRFNKDLSRNRTQRHADNVLRLLAELHQPTDARRPFPTRTLKATSLDLAGLLGQLNQSAETRDR